MKKKLSILIAVVLLVSLAVTGGVLATLKKQTTPVENTFTAVPFPSVKIQEGFSDYQKEKTNACVEVNDLYTPVYVRAAIVYTLVDGKDKTTIGRTPVEGEDYTVDLNTGNWVKWGDYYYYTSPLTPDGKHTAVTAELIKTCTTLSKDQLNVDVLAQVIQVGREKAAWGIEFNGGAWE